MSYQPQAFRFLQEVSQDVTESFFHASYPTLRVQATKDSHPKLTVSLGDLKEDGYEFLIGSTEKCPSELTPRQILEAEADSFGDAKSSLTLMLDDEIIQQGSKLRS